MKKIKTSILIILLSGSAFMIGYTIKSKPITNENLLKCEEKGGRYLLYYNRFTDKYTESCTTIEVDITI